jgi:hypothetical protein
MNKQNIVNAIIAQLETDQTTLIDAAKDSHAAATHSESAAETKWDTFGLESSYLAEGQQKRVMQISEALLYFRELDCGGGSEGGSDKENVDPMIAELSFIRLLGPEDDEQRRFFLAKSSGGLKVVVDHIQVMVITPHSPLGATLLNKTVEDEVDILVKGVSKIFEIVEIC